MKIYCQYSNNKSISPTRGDFINEIGTMIAMTRFADVYYSGNLFDKRKKNYGMSNYKKDIISKMLSQEYDVYYIRNNPKLLKYIPKNKLKIYFCSPYDNYAFKKADFIATTTKTWSEYLKNGIYIDKLNPNSEKFSSEPFYQTIFDCYNTEEHEETKKIKKRIGDGFIIGSFGRVVYSDHPNSILSSIDALNSDGKNVKLALSIYGKRRKNVSIFRNNFSDKVYHFDFNHRQMKFAYSACDITVASYCGPSWDFAGSLKTIESAACGIPVILGRGIAREELFGKDYELFINKDLFRSTDTKDISELINKILYLYKNRDKMHDISKMLIEQSKFYSIENSAARLKSIIGNYI